MFLPDHLSRWRGRSVVKAFSSNTARKLEFIVFNNNNINHITCIARLTVRSRRTVAARRIFQLLVRGTLTDRAGSFFFFLKYEYDMLFSGSISDGWVLHFFISTPPKCYSILLKSGIRQSPSFRATFIGFTGLISSRGWANEACALLFLHTISPLWPRETMGSEETASHFQAPSQIRKIKRGILR